MKTRIASSMLIVIACLSVPAASSAAGRTPAEQKIDAAKARIQAYAARVEGYTDLAWALASRARETANPDYYVQATSALAEARRLDPESVEADKVEAWLLLGMHEFGRALDKALAVNRRVPDDLMTYGMLVDAYVELGRYREAEDAAQWMLDLRPGAIPGLTRAAYLREIFGDVDGALQLMQQALDELPSREAEERAWVMVQISHLRLEQGRIDAAEAAARDARAAFPGYHYALGALARVSERRGDHPRAATLFEERYQHAPHPENLFDWARALERAGRTSEAKQRFAEFERQAAAESGRRDNANRELALYYVDHAHRPADAVALMERELARRRSIPVLDAYAWALFKAGRIGEARKIAKETLAVGTADTAIRRHTTAILGNAN